MNRVTFPSALKLGDPATLPTTGRSVGDLQAALIKLKLAVQASDLARKEMGSSTVAAVRAFQTRAGLPADGKLTADTVARLNAESAHTFVTQSKTRTRRLKEALQLAGQKIDSAELKSQKLGPSTEAALKQFQAKIGVRDDGRVSEGIVNRLREDALKSRLGSTGQVARVQRTLLRVLNIAKLKDVRIDASELKRRKIGPSTQAAIKALQTKYGLPATGVTRPERAGNRRFPQAQSTGVGDSV